MMPRKTLVRQLFPSFVLITLLTLGILGWYAMDTLRDFYREQTRDDLKARAHLIVRQVDPWFEKQVGGRVHSFCQELGKASSTRITLIEPSGNVLCDSVEEAGRMDNHNNRPEIVEALAGGVGASVRFSDTLQADLMYVALPVFRNSDIVGVARTSLPLTSIDQTLNRLAIRMGIIGLALAMVAGGASFFFSRRISRHLDRMKTSAVQFAEGDFTSRLPLSDTEEFAGLAQALNQMAAQLDDRIRAVTEQRNERDAILSSMVEGVCAVDLNERFINLNQAAAGLMGIEIEQAQGRTIQEVVRNAQLQDFVTRALKSQGEVEGDIILNNHGEDRYLQVRGTLLRDSNNNSTGAVIVLNDVTRLRRLETVRRDFVANVSHELKTPITSIKGFVETLLDGALDEKEDAKRFLEIVAKQSDRLNAIIEDLLSLSRIEQGTEQNQIVTENCILKKVLDAAFNDCSPKAAQKDIMIEIECDAHLEVNVNPPLLEEALVNLVDNAIKYSEPNKRVEVRAQREEEGVVVQVIDQGRGIDQEHLPRLFERFYRVDKARSRQMGGTGLGLAIVKHIAQAHGGSVHVESTPGEGSRFFIHLPQ